MVQPPMTLAREGLAAEWFIGWPWNLVGPARPRPQNPIAAIFFPEDATFAFKLACVMTIVCAHLLRQRLNP